MKKGILMAMFIVFALMLGMAQSSAKYAFSNSSLSQNLQVKWLSSKKINFTYTIKEKSDDGKLKTIVFKGVATSLGGDGESDEDIDGAYDVDEYMYQGKTCQVFFRIASDKSKCKVKNGGCKATPNISSFDTMIKL